MKLEKERLNRIFERFYTRLNELNTVDESTRRTLIKKELESVLSQEIQTAVQKERAKLKEVFIDWAGDSQYVTGAWNDEEQEPYKEGEYWEQRARSAWGQLEYLLNKSTTKDTKDVV